MIINLVSGPRNISTALMYAFAQRQDIKVIDEPFYACYLHQNDIDHPGQKEIIRSQPIVPSEVIQQIHQQHKESEHIFIKNMAQHHGVVNWDYLIDMKNVFLIRDPRQLVVSFAKIIDKPTIKDIGLKLEWEVYEYVQQHGKYESLVIDSNQILTDPRVQLEILCNQLSLEFDPAMLNWKKGGIPEDGVWAPYWYKNVHHSTGFAPQESSSDPLPNIHRALYEEALPYYEKLASYIKG